MQDNGANQTTTTEFDDLTLEQALTMLDGTIAALESGSLTLTESVDHYELGMKLAHVCNETLTSAELRIARIRTAYGEQMRMAGDEE